MIYQSIQNRIRPQSGEHGNSYSLSQVKVRSRYSIDLSEEERRIFYGFYEGQATRSLR